MVYRFLFVVIASMIIGGPRSSSLTPVYRERITIRSDAVTIAPSDPARTRVGSLTLVGGWRLSSLSGQFGGWSALHVADDRVTAIGDAGSVLRFRLGQFGRAVDARIDPLPSGCRRSDGKRDRDSESLVPLPDGWLIGFESRTRICRVTADFARATAVRAPREMASWLKAGGPEAMVRLADGRVLVFAEKAPDNSALYPMLVFAGDPTDAETRVLRRTYRPPTGYSPTDAAQLPDGRLIVVNRRFDVTQGFTAVVVVIDLATIVSNRPAAGAPPVLSDNYEGVAVTIEHGKPVVWMLSDDNFMRWESTYLLKFRLDANI
jgi:hypothetical protein